MWGRRRLKLRLGHQREKEREELSRQQMPPQVALTPNSLNHALHIVYMSCSDEATLTQNIGWGWRC